MGIDIREIATDALVAELAKRHGAAVPDPATDKPECSSGERGAYDTALHVFALVLILTLSTLACAAPLLSTRSGSSARRPDRPSTVIFACQHFGTGVLIATAFVHLLPTAFTSLTDPCLPDAFNVGYRPLAGLVAMASALAVVWIESYLATRGARHSHAHHNHGGWEELAGDEDEDEAPHGPSASRAAAGANASGPEAGGARLAARREIAMQDIETTALFGDVSPLPGLSPRPVTPTVQINGNASESQSNGRRRRRSGDSGSDSDSDLDIDLEELGTTSPVAARGVHHHPSPKSGLPAAAPTDHVPPAPPAPPLPSEERHRLVLQCLLLEAGILFHSVFIGMALSVATGPTFIVFLVAISFHQSFEGLALGSRIAALHYPRSSPRPWLMVLAYGTTTPIGQAIGLVIHNMYDPRSVVGLLMVGFMNAISSGLLLFAGLVQLLAEDFLSEKSYRVLKGRRRTWAFAAVAAGAGLMALVGAFA